MTDPEAAPRPGGPSVRAVHLLMVHGVGRHDRLSSLLKVYQSFRSNTRSPEAPINFEDLIPDWELDEVNEDAAPPYLKLVPRFPDAIEVSAVYLYEVNYSSMAGVVRENHPLDLTQLFVGFDMAVLLSRLGLRPQVVRPLCQGRPTVLAECLQRVSGVFVAATVPILGAPSILLRNYTETLVATFTRFFEDVATFALDKDGEKLIAAHIDKTVENIVESGRFASVGAGQQSELVIAAHSLGSVVVHNHLVRHWSTKPDCVPSLLLTFGSPIGLLTWLWLFLDFPGFDVRGKDQLGLNFFCWGINDNAGLPATPLRWINVVNCLDPIATAFTSEATDLTRAPQEIEVSLRGGGVLNRFCGDARLSSTGTAHAKYLHDRETFIKMLLSAASLRDQDPTEIVCAQPEEHWKATSRTLGRMRVLLWVLAMVCAASYCGLVAWKFWDWRVYLLLPAFAFPRATVAGVAFFQRLFFGGVTKRVSADRIATLSWRNSASWPYLMRLWFARGEVDPEAHGHSTGARLLKVLSFVPTFVAMLVPIAFAGLVAGVWPNPWAGVGYYLGGLLFFSAYLILCAGFELIAAWREVLRELELVPGWARRAHPLQGSP